MNAAAGIVEVRVPDMGNFKDVAIIDVLVKPGEKIEPEAPLVTLETEKATMDVPSTVGGVVEKVHVSKGGTVSPGDLIVTVRSEGIRLSGRAGRCRLTAAAKSHAPAAAAGQGTALTSAQWSARRWRLRRRRVEGARQQAGRRAIACTPAAVSQSGRRRPGPERRRRLRPKQVRGSRLHSATAASVRRAAAAQSASRRRPLLIKAVPRAARPARPLLGGNGLTADQRAWVFASPRRSFRAQVCARARRRLTQVKGSGFKGRVTHEDVKAFVKNFLAKGARCQGAAYRAPGGGGALPSIPAVDFTPVR